MINTNIKNPKTGIKNPKTGIKNPKTGIKNFCVYKKGMITDKTSKIDEKNNGKTKYGLTPPFSLATKRGVSMKIMKLVHIFTPKTILCGVCIGLLLCIQMKTSYVYCGHCGSKMSGLGPILKHRQVFSFAAESGKKYNIFSEFYKLRNDYFTNIEIKDFEGRPLQPKNLANNYNHLIANMFLENYGQYLRNEMADKFSLAENKIKILEENLREIFINFLLTKQAITNIQLDTSIYKVQNFLLSKHLYTGEKFDQYINAIVHLISSGDFETLVRYANDPQIDSKIIKNSENLEIFTQLAPDKAFNEFVQKVLGDLIQIVDPEVMKLKLQMPMVLEGYTFDYTGKIISKTLLTPQTGPITKSEFLLEKLDIHFNIRSIDDAVESSIKLK